MNDKPFTHDSRHGTRFKATRCDFRDGVELIDLGDATTKELISDVAEMIGYHATNIHPNLNGFAGYDCIQWTIIG
jgi:hypothetical protein